MADIFKKEDAFSLLRGKHVLFIGDSNIRALYKDLLWLYKLNSLISLNVLKRRVGKLEGSFLGDRLISRSELTRGRDFTEHRIFEDGETVFEFLFVTRCYCDNIVNMINDIKNGTKHCPDVILMNSCLWDVSRWGPSGVSTYKSNMDKLMKLLTSSLPKDVLFIWATALPIASVTSGGLIIKQIEFLQAILRIHVIEANSFTASLAASYGFDVLDFHHYMRYQIIRRSADGIHFLPSAMRFLTNLLLTHIALSWDVKLPGNLKIWKMPLASSIEKAIEGSANHEVKQMFRKIEILADTLNNAADTPSKKKKKNKKKIRNMRITHYGINPYEARRERDSMKTPQNYHKALSVFMRLGSDILNNNSVNEICYNDNNLPSSSNCLDNNNQIMRRCEFGNVNNITFPEKDFRLTGFDDFSKDADLSDDFDLPSAQHQPYNQEYDLVRNIPVNTNYYIPPNPGYSGYNGGNQVELQTATIFPCYNRQNVNPTYGFHSRYPNQRSHPYKSSYDDQMEYAYDAPRNLISGPMRRRNPRYRNRRY